MPTSSPAPSPGPDLRRAAPWAAGAVLVCVLAVLAARAGLVHSRTGGRPLPPEAVLALTACLAVHLPVHALVPGHPRRPGPADGVSAPRALTLGALAVALVALTVAALGPALPSQSAAPTALQRLGSDPVSGFRLLLALAASLSVPQAVRLALPAGAGGRWRHGLREVLTVGSVCLTSTMGALMLGVGSPDPTTEGSALLAVPACVGVLLWGLLLCLPAVRRRRPSVPRGAGRRGGVLVVLFGRAMAGWAAAWALTEGALLVTAWATRQDDVAAWTLPREVLAVALVLAGPAVTVWALHGPGAPAREDGLGAADPLLVVLSGALSLAPAATLWDATAVSLLPLTRASGRADVLLEGGIVACAALWANAGLLLAAGRGGRRRRGGSRGRARTGAVWAGMAVAAMGSLLAAGHAWGRLAPLASVNPGSTAWSLAGPVLLAATTGALVGLGVQAWSARRTASPATLDRIRSKQ